ncbi:unnamed protein product, partial [marine sediment metagenome]
AHRVLLIVALVVGALMMTAAVGQPAHAWLAWFALLPLFFVIRLWRPIHAAEGGALWGVFIFVFSITQPAPAIAPTVQSLVLLTTAPAIYAGLGATVTRWIGFNPFILGVAWMGLELALAPAGLRSGLLGAAPAQGAIMEWVGGALGYVLVAFFVVLVSASLVSVLSGVRFTVLRLLGWVSLPDRGAAISPQTSVDLSLFASRSFRPRAPPDALATLNLHVVW